MSKNILFSGIDTDQAETLEHFKYNPATNKLEADKPIETTLSSLHLGEQHTVSSGGENVFFTNEHSKVNWFPAWGGVTKGQNIKASARNYSELRVKTEPSGTNYFPFRELYENPENISVFEFSLVSGQALTAGEVLRYSVSVYDGAEADEVDSEVFRSNLQHEVYEDYITLEEDLDLGETLIVKFEHPVEIHAGAVIYDQLVIESTGEYFLALEGDRANVFAQSIEYKTFTDDELALKKDAGAGNIYITGVVGADNTEVVFKANPNEEVIESVGLSDLDATVTVEWDRSSAYEGAPTVNGVVVTRTDKIGGSTYVGTADISGTYEEIVADLQGSQHIVPVEVLGRPVINSTMFTGNYPGPQTEVKAGDFYNLTIDADTAYVAVETQDYGACAEVSYVADGDIPALIADRGDEPVARPARVRVQNAQGTWSAWAETSNTVVCNNLHPTITVDTKQYPSYGMHTAQSALKDDEEVVIRVSYIDTDSVNYSATNNLELTADGAKRVSGDYEDGTYTIKALRDANGAILYHQETVRIAHADVELLDNDPVQVRSGVGEVELPCTFTQELMEWPPSTGDFSNPTMTATDGVPHGMLTRFKNVTVRNLAGKEVELGRAYFIKGFAEKTLTLTYPAETIAIGTNIVEPSDVVISGTINTSPPYTICTHYTPTCAPLVNVGDYHLLSAGSIELYGAKLDEFYYSPDNNITITIEEL